jgi:hypothetical protein
MGLNMRLCIIEIYQEVAVVAKAEGNTPTVQRG